MANETEVSSMLLVAMLPPLHQRERVYLQIENDSAQYERFVTGVRLTHNIGSLLGTPLLCCWQMKKYLGLLFEAIVQ